MSTNQDLYGGNMAGYSHMFVAPIEVFYAKTMTVKIYDEEGNVIGTELVDIPTYYQIVDPANGRPPRTIKRLKGSTHAASPFNTDENKGEFTTTKQNVIAAGIEWGGNDYTLTGNVAYNLPFSEYCDKFQHETPLNKVPE